MLLHLRIRKDPYSHRPQHKHNSSIKFNAMMAIFHINSSHTFSWAASLPSFLVTCSGAPTYFCSLMIKQQQQWMRSKNNKTGALPEQTSRAFNHLPGKLSSRPPLSCGSMGMWVEKWEMSLLLFSSSRGRETETEVEPHRCWWLWT